MFLIYHLVHLVNPIFYGCYYTNSPTTPFVPGGNGIFGDGAYIITLLAVMAEMEAMEAVVMLT